MRVHLMAVAGHSGAPQSTRRHLVTWSGRRPSPRAAQPRDPPPLLRVWLRTQSFPICPLCRIILEAEVRVLGGKKGGGGQGSWGDLHAVDS